MKIYNLGILIEPKENCDEIDIMNEIHQQIEKDGQELILCPVRGNVTHQVVIKADISLFPACLTAGTKRLALGISLPTKKDLGRRWFLKRLEGENKSSYLLIATTDVAVIHIEVT
ncbi:hypothetical protein [Sporomusa malonica]|uniref:Uncharacterized protein n=1 Tax=Sporomusa malonica TaxID=112901 RepID=A0A1W1ZU99_9FIRM|nr:hypothetical protein [Sporomusa malonica]SMC52065.1 hypothetical protein SAMN04488500_104212 [Sporomusa malonica]